jgi:hypothetical protein
MALWPFVRPWRFFQFLNAIHSRQDSLNGGSAHRKAATYTQDSRNTEYAHTDIHALSGIRTHDPSLRVSEFVRWDFRYCGHYCPIVPAPDDR